MQVKTLEDVIQEAFPKVPECIVKELANKIRKMNRCQEGKGDNMQDKKLSEFITYIETLSKKQRIEMLDELFINLMDWHEQSDEENLYIILSGVTKFARAIDK